MLNDTGLDPFLGLMLMVTTVVYVACFFMNRSVKREQEKIDQRKALKKTKLIIGPIDKNCLNEKTPAHI